MKAVGTLNFKIICYFLLLKSLVGTRKLLVGANPTGLTRSLEYVDGTLMPDGYFSDVDRTWIGDLVYSTQHPECLRINKYGNVIKCNTKCTDENGNGMECEQVLCEKKIAPKDTALCLDKSATVESSKITLNNAVDISIPVRTMSFHHCRWFDKILLP